MAEQMGDYDNSSESSDAYNDPEMTQEIQDAYEAFLSAQQWMNEWLIERRKIFWKQLENMSESIRHTHTLPSKTRMNYRFVCLPVNDQNSKVFRQTWHFWGIRAFKVSKCLYYKCVFKVFNKCINKQSFVSIRKRRNERTRATFTPSSSIVLI